MTRSVTFNGVTRFRPGGITKVNADALNQIGANASNVIGLIGESDGGAPGSVSGLISLRDPSRAVEMFRSGPLVDAIRLAFQSSGDPNIPGGAGEVLVYKTNLSTQSTIRVPDPAGAFSSTTVNVAPAPTTTVFATVATFTVAADAWVGRWVDVTIAALPGAPTYRRKIVSNTVAAGAAVTLTVSPALPSAPAAADVLIIRPTLMVLSSVDYGLHANDISVDATYSDTTHTYQVTVSSGGEDQVSEPIGGDNFLQLYYRGGPNNIAQGTLLTPADFTTLTFDVTGGGLVGAAHVGMSVKVTNPATGNFEQHKISTNTATVVTLEAPGFSADFLTEIKAATASTVTFDITSVTAATAQVTGASGVASALVSTITGVAGDNLALTISATQTLSELVTAINANSNYLAVVPSGVNGSLLASTLDFGVAAINIQKSIAVNGGLGFRRDLAQVVDWFNNSCEKVTAVRATSETTDGSFLPATAALTDALFALPFELTGGSRGTSSNTRWQSGFDAMILRKADQVVPLIDRNLSAEGLGSTATWASVAAQLVDHVSLGRGMAGKERGGFIGFRGTKTQYIAACLSLNDMDVQCVSQNPTVLDATGTLVEKAPREAAVMAASMRAGVPEVGEPLTFKYLRCSSMTQDTSWDPRDLTDAADLILAGALFAEVVPGKGVRWVRDLTTWVKNDNLAYSEGSVRSIVRYVAYELRTLLEDRFTGKKALPATVASVKDAAVFLLEQFRDRGIIVDSTDPATGVTIRAYHNIKIFTTGDILKLNVGIFPVPGINFQLSEIFLQLPSQVAA